MAQIDPEMQRRFNAAALKFGDACKRLVAAADNATAAIGDLALQLDTPHAKAAKNVAKEAISKAKNGSS